MKCLVATSSFDLFRSAIKSPALIDVADHWQEARGQKRMPSWSDIRPARIAPHLTRVWSFKYDRASGEFTARLAGNQVMLGFGMSFRGTPLKDIHPPQVFEVAQERMTRMVLGSYLYRNSGKLFRVGDYVASGERIVLPLASDGENGDGVLGASDFPRTPRVTQRRTVELMYDVEEWFALKT